MELFLSTHYPSFMVCCGWWSIFNKQRLMHIPMDKLNYGISYFQHVINMMQIVNLIIIGKQDLWT